MLSVILTILKVIGIILLVIIGLLLTVTLTVLFVPIKYQSDGDFKKLDDGFKDNVSVRVTWILRILSVSFNLTDTKPELVLRIFGRKLMLGAKNDKKSPKRALKKRDESKVSFEDMAEEKNEEDTIKKDDILFKQSDSNTTTGTAALNTATDDAASTYKAVSDDAPDAVAEEKKSIKKKLYGIKSKVLDIWNKIDAICKKIKNVNSIKDSFVEYLKKEESKLAIKEIKKILLKVLKKLLPREVTAKIKFGFEDPSTTGNVLGITSIFYGVYGGKLELEPDFENVVLEGEYNLKGKIRLINVVSAALKIYRNKWLRNFIVFSKKTINKIKNE